MCLMLMFFPRFKPKMEFYGLVFEPRTEEKIYLLILTTVHNSTIKNLFSISDHKLVFWK